MIHTHTFNALTVQTGDILCTSNGTDHNWFGRFWQWVGYLVPGRIDHAILYVGPGGRCVEAGGKGVIEFAMPGKRWNAPKVADIRLLHDTLVGVAYPLQGLGLSTAEETRIRTGVAAYCLEQIGKPYNANFLNTVTDEAFYCSQLIYLAYREFGVDLGVSPVQMVAEQAAPNATPLLILPTALLDNAPNQLVQARPRFRRKLTTAKVSST
ncbi:MAG: YiiX/YebB-like N1pC/P60 family cysteine hydrolase [Caldilineaceae bacterium]